MKENNATTRVRRPGEKAEGKPEERNQREHSATDV